MSCGHFNTSLDFKRPYLDNNPLFFDGPAVMKLEDIFKTIDSRDAAGFAHYFSDIGKFRFANSPVVTGKQAIQQFVDGFFTSIAALEHQLIENWPIEDGQVCHGLVTYTRHDQTTLSIPFALVVKFDKAGISEYLIFADTAKLFSEPEI